MYVLVLLLHGVDSYLTTSGDKHAFITWGLLGGPGVCRSVIGEAGGGWKDLDGRNLQGAGVHVVNVHTWTHGLCVLFTSRPFEYHVLVVFPIHRPARSGCQVDPVSTFPDPQIPMIRFVSHA